MFFRNKNLILFYSCQQSFTGNCKYIHLEVKRQYPHKRLVWLTSTDKSAKLLENKNGIEAYRKDSITGKWLRLRAGYSISDGSWQVGYFDLFQLAIDFWHGFPFKKIWIYDTGLGSHSLYKKKLLKLYFLINKMYMVHISHSQYALEVILNAYRAPIELGKILGSPRLEPLMLNKVDLHNRIEIENGELNKIKNDISNYKKVYLYAPTYRDDQGDFLNKLGLDLKSLNQSLIDQDAVFLFKMHPFSEMEIDQNNFSNIRVILNLSDVYLLMSLSHTIITDYSSIFIDVIWNKDKEVILIHGDLESYRKNCRDIYDEQLSDMKHALILRDFSHLIDFINGKLPYQVPSQEIINKYWDKSVLDNIHGYMSLIK